MPHIPMEYTVDLGKTINVTPLHTLFAMGDDNAHRFAFSFVQGGKPVDLSGCTVLATYTNFSPHGVTVNLDGKIEDGKAVALLSKACYTMEGRFAIVVRLKNSVGTSAIFYGDGYMSRTTSDTVIDGDYIIYDVSTLLEKIAEINEATISANSAAQNANTAAGTANAAAINANTEAQNANTAAEAANTAAENWDSSYAADSAKLGGKSPAEYASTAEVSALKDDLSAEQTARKSADNVLTARMDEFTALPDGSTTGDAELADIRVGADGTTYTTAGEAVRGQIGAVKSDLATIGAQCSDFKEISGYDVNTGYRWGLDVNGKSQLFEYSNGTAYEIDVKSGEKYKISGYTNSDSTHSILFGNAEGVYTRFTDYATPPISDYEITIPNGIVKMHITALLVDRYGFSVKKYMIAKSAITEDGLKELTYTKSEIDAILGEGTLPDYYYENGWMQNKINNINAMAENVENGVSFCWFTDLHFLYNAKNSKYLLKEIRRNTPVEYVFCGGDFVWAYGDKTVLKDAEVEWQQYRDCIGPRNVFTIRGNHDFTIRTSQTETTGYTATETETYSYISKKMEQEGIGIRPGRNYYYVDNSAQKVRFICIDEFSIHNHGTTDAYWDLLPAIPQEQYDWIINDALNVSDYTIVFMAHGACDPEIYAAMGNLKPLRDLLNSFRNKTSINQTYANGIILNHDFSNDTNTLACFICGHGHKDQSHEENGVLTIATAADYRSGDDTVTREFGTVSEQAIDVFTINTQDRTIKTVRVGGGEDREWAY